MNVAVLQMIYITVRACINTKHPRESGVLFLIKPLCSYQRFRNLFGCFCFFLLSHDQINKANNDMVFL